MPTGRIANYTAIVFGIVIILVFQYIGIAMLGPLGDEIKDSGDNLDAMNGVQIIDEMFIAITKWVPLTAGFGLILTGFIQEYRRQRVGAVRRRRTGL